MGTYREYIMAIGYSDKTGISNTITELNEERSHY